MMVIMTLVTTFMTTPLLAWVYPDRLMSVAPAFSIPPERQVELAEARTR
jgi:hypothetical protein